MVAFAATNFDDLTKERLIAYHTLESDVVLCRSMLRITRRQHDPVRSYH